LPVVCEVLPLASRTRCEPRNRGHRHRRDKGEPHRKQPRETAPDRSNRPMHCAPRLPPVYGSLRSAGLLLARSLAGICGVRLLVVLALTASVACTGATKAPEAAAPVAPTPAPVPVVPAIASAEPLPAVSLPPVAAPITSLVPLPTALPIPSAPALPIASARPLSTIPAAIRSAAPISTPILPPLPTTLPIPPLVR
jgi:hypothetical protein